MNENQYLPALGSFHIINDLAPLVHMIKAMSLTLTPKARQRLAWMDAYRECQNAARICRHFSIPLRTFWRWRKRYDPWDLKSLEDGSRKPKHFPRRTPWPVEQRVLALKAAHVRWGKEKLALVLERQGTHLSGKTCWRILKRHSRIVRYRTRKRKPLKPRVDWAEVRVPGDLVQVDAKYVSLNGMRLFQYTAIDVVSRFRHAEIHYALDQATTIRFLESVRQTASFKTRVVQTDNGSEFGKQVSAFLRTKGIRHVFSHVRRPQENAYVERSHRIDEEEFWSLGPFGTTVAELRSRFSLYLTQYNTERPSWALQGRTPVDVLADYHLQPCHMS